VLKVVFQLNDDDPLYKPLDTAGYDDVQQLLAMSVEDIDGLTYPDASNTNVPIPSFAKAWIRILKAYHLHRNEQGHLIGNDWLMITVEEFDEFRIGPVYSLMSMGIPSASSMTPQSASTARTRDPVADFK
jgi:hypothetical protein